jgi:general secretion pathway protein M
VLLLAVPIGLSTLVSSRRADNEELKDALSDVNGARAKLRDRQDRKNSIASRYAKKAPQLGGFLEQEATTAKVQIADSVDRPDVQHGKGYTERQTTIHLKNVGLGPISKFLESIEKSGNPVSVTRLNIRKRVGEPDSYGPVEVGVSAYDRNITSSSSSSSPAASASAGKDKK